MFLVMCGFSGETQHPDALVLTEVLRVSEQELTVHNIRNKQAANRTFNFLIPGIPSSGTPGQLLPLWTVPALPNSLLSPPCACFLSTPTLGVCPGWNARLSRWGGGLASQLPELLPPNSAPGPLLHLQTHQKGHPNTKAILSH